jgi:hypothetical protein
MNHELVLLLIKGRSGFQTLNSMIFQINYSHIRAMT